MRFMARSVGSFLLSVLFWAFAAAMMMYFLGSAHAQDEQVPGLGYGACFSLVIGGHTVVMILLALEQLIRDLNDN